MEPHTVIVRVFRFDPQADQQPRYQEFTIPLVSGMSIMHALDYIYQNLDSTIAYLNHAACGLGICGRCAVRINGKAGLMCRTALVGDVTIEPINPNHIVRDLVAKMNQQYAGDQTQKL